MWNADFRYGGGGLLSTAAADRSRTWPTQVFFHPEYTFRDGKQRMGGEEAAANFARRSPYPMINLLRTPQVRAAQKGIPTGSVYEVNEENLQTVSQCVKALLEKREPPSTSVLRLYFEHILRGVLSVRRGLTRVVS